MRRSLDGSSVLSSDDLSDYDVISDGHQSLESSIADLSHVGTDGADIREPSPSRPARDRFDTVGLSPADIQAYVRRALPPDAGARYAADADSRTVRVYVDGVFDPFQARDALQLRQAKLAFPSVCLLVGVFADELCEAHRTPIIWAHVDRCEVLRHCRWVDEVVPDAPWTLDEKFLRAKRIDYVAVDEGSSVNPACDKERLKGYDLVKSLRRAIPTRRTNVLTSIDTRGLSLFVESTKGTIRGAPPQVAPARPSARISGDDDVSPFEEPKVDEFGIGIGV
ncbi:uncharacterized protein FIBRA_01685 [Fibroporia radiculosa]|uniref:choline-phosphate cytidylyltransferase n=1 Tax=Fibroporia radiculosa TaxID=599839 RepID=J4H1C6_9APHY|nr:uncharacterized protein FIBRA_01685 [Fibroporia radiculosa]CCL99664.1 predicted protein [Fibroporia radiculosa]